MAYDAIDHLRKNFSKSIVSFFYGIRSGFVEKAMNETNDNLMLTATELEKLKEADAAEGKAEWVVGAKQPDGRLIDIVLALAFHKNRNGPTNATNHISYFP